MITKYVNRYLLDHKNIAPEGVCLCSMLSSPLSRCSCFFRMCIANQLHYHSSLRSAVVCRQRAQGHLGQDFFEKGGGLLPGHGRLFITL